MAIRIVLKEEDFLALVSGKVVAKDGESTADPGVEIILNDIGWDRMRIAVTEAEYGFDQAKWAKALEYADLESEAVIDRPEHVQESLAKGLEDFPGFRDGLDANPETRSRFIKFVEETVGVTF